ncbi:MAG TPA: hypothetical protein VJU82_03385 [Acidobacteriaceae bacterium]|nr:hypothetical protein [Acidobacteriaceae bacterium]
MQMRLPVLGPGRTVSSAAGQKLTDFGQFCTFCGMKTEENRKKPVETGENPLTFAAKTPNVNFGTLVGPA